MGFYTDIAKEDRFISYEFIESFISTNVRDWSHWNVTIGTDKVESLFSKEIHQMNKKDFEFLLLHCGYIPDYYGDDSSQETLYSKLIESMVCEWAKRVGFTESFLQKQKSNKEDITIKKGDKVIVCDAKSFRLGRSQAAPNVKDTIKKQAYNTWLSSYRDDCRVGGLTTFPSKHDWKSGGEAYAYYTEGNPSIMLLFYEHLAFILNQNIGSDKIIEVLNSYNTIFPHSSKNKSYYWDRIKSSLFKDNTNYSSYMNEARTYTNEKVTHTIDTISNMLSKIDNEIEKHLDSVSEKELRNIAKEAIYKNRTEKLQAQLKHIKDFRC